MNFNALRLFHQVAHRGSFSKAATAVHVSQPAVSKAVAELEASIGMKLFDRRHRPLVLTPAGWRLFARAETIFNTERDAHMELQALREAPRQVLRIVCSATLAIHAMAAPVAAFLRQHPDVRLDITTGDLHSVATDIGAGRADLGLIEGLAAGFEHLSTSPWIEQELSLLAPPGHPLAGQGEPVPLARLAGERLVLRESGSATLGFVTRLLASADLTPANPVVVPENALMVALCAAGAGLTIAPVEVAAPYIAQGMLRRVALDVGRLARTTLKVKVETGPLSPEAHLFEALLDAQAEAPSSPSS